MRGLASMAQVLEVLGRLDRQGGAQLHQVAWELEAEEHQVLEAWRDALSEGLIRVGRRDPEGGEARWRLTPGGWAALGQAGRSRTARS